MSANDRTPCNLLAMPVSAGLERLAVWLEDCEAHVDQKREGGVPAPPFTFEQAWMLARLAARATIGVANDNPSTPEPIRAAIDKVNFALDRALRAPETPLLSCGASINAILKHVAGAPAQAARS